MNNALQLACFRIQVQAFDSNGLFASEWSPALITENHSELSDEDGADEENEYLGKMNAISLMSVLKLNDILWSWIRSKIFSTQLEKKMFE